MRDVRIGLFAVTLFAACNDDAVRAPDLATMVPDLATNESRDLSVGDLATRDSAVPDLAQRDLRNPNLDLSPITVELLTSTTLAAYNGSDSIFNTFYQSKKQQFVYLASDLTAAGIGAGATLVGLGFQPSQLPARQIDGLRIALANTTAAPDPNASFPTPFFVAAPTVVYGPTDQPVSRFVVDRFTRFDLAPFVWDGTSNLMVELSYTLAVDSVAGGGIAIRDTGRANERLQYYVHGSVAYPFAGHDAINGVANVPAIEILYY